jgi:hypothetical protein
MGADNVAPPAEHVPAVLSSLLAVLQLSSEPKQIDDIVAVLVELVKRDERKSEQGVKLGDKLVKWLQIEGDKAANNTKAYALLDMRSTKSDDPDQHQQVYCHLHS